MPYFNAADGTELYFSAWGNGRPLVFIHGANVGAEVWEFQIPYFVEAGWQCISYDQRGFDRSDCPSKGYDADTLASDLDRLVEHLGLTRFAVAAFSVGGAVLARYLSRFGSAKVERAILVAPTTPFLLRTDDNPEGLERDTVYEPVRLEMKKDRRKFFDDCLNNFFNPNSSECPVSDGIRTRILNLALRSPLMPMLEIFRTSSTTDFREDMKAFTMPTLIVHGDADVFVPVHNSGARTHKMISSSELRIYRGASHGLLYTHQHRLNGDIAQFLK